MEIKGHSSKNEFNFLRERFSARQNSFTRKGLSDPVGLFIFAQRRKKGEKNA